MSDTDSFGFPPSLADIERLAKSALATIPAELRQHATDVVIRVEEFPDEETEDEMELETPFDLLGLYRGVSLPDKSVTAPPAHTNMVFLYRRPLLDFWCETGEDLTDIVRHVLIHEIGHHFGFSDEDMERLEDDA
jgi:predicted Zn-dependent protease with MMP-like domain